MFAAARRLYREFLSNLGWSLYHGQGFCRSATWAAREAWRGWRRPVPPPMNQTPWDGIVETTLRNRTPQLAEAIMRNNPLLRRMTEKGRANV